MSDVHSFVNASQAFFNRLGEVRTGPLAIALIRSKYLRGMMWGKASIFTEAHGRQESLHGQVGLCSAA